MVTAVKLAGTTVRDLLAAGKTSQAVNLLIATGHGHHVTIGTLTSPVTGGGGTAAIVLQQPEGVVSIGSSQAMIPIRIKVELEVGLIANDNEVDEILVAVDRTTAAGGLNITANVPESVFNMRTDLGDSVGGEISAYSAVTENITQPTLGIELARAQNFRDKNGVTPANVLGTEMNLLYEPKHPPVLVGSAAGLALYVYWGGTVAVAGFAQIQLCVFPSAWVTELL